VAHDHFPWDLLIPLFPQLLIVVILVAFLALIGPRRVWLALRRVKKIGFAGLEIELADYVEAAAANRHNPVSTRDADRAGQILADSAPLLSCARILWVDDDPSGNVWEMKILRRLCVALDLAESTDGARDSLRRGVYDIVISDMTRHGSSRAGEEIVPLVRSCPLPPHLIFYTLKQWAKPEGAFGMAVTPDKLFTLIVAALGKRRG
jgi:hypothetical protein